MNGSSILRGQDSRAAETFWETGSTPPVGPAAAEAPSLPAAVFQLRDTELSRRQEEQQQAIKAAQEAAYLSGLCDGQAEGRKTLEHYSAVNQKLAATIRELAGFKADLRKQAINELVQLAFGIAQRILHREIHTDPEALRGIVAAALERANRQELVCVRAHPDHSRALHNALDALEPGSTVEICSDPGLAHGSVLFEMKGGMLDASVDSQLQEVQHGLADRLRE